MNVNYSTCHIMQGSFKNHGITVNPFKLSPKLYPPCICDLQKSKSIEFRELRTCEHRCAEYCSLNPRLLLFVCSVNNTARAEMTQDGALNILLWRVGHSIYIYIYIYALHSTSLKPLTMPCFLVCSFNETPHSTSNLCADAGSAKWKYA